MACSASVSAPAIRNRLLAALPAEALDRLRPLLTSVELPLHDVLHQLGKPINEVYFPESGWISMLAYLHAGLYGGW